MKLATVRVPHLSTHAIGERVQEQSPRDSDAQQAQGQSGSWPERSFRPYSSDRYSCRSTGHKLPSTPSLGLWTLPVDAGGYVRFVHVHPVPASE